MFDGSSTFDAIGSQWDDGSFDLQFTWSFGDGYFSSETSPMHTYDTDGTYHATLTVLNSFGQSNDASMVINVSAIPVPPAIWLFGSGLVGLIGVARRKLA